MKKIYLNVPSKDDLHYRQEWMNDPKIMNYNAGFDMDLKGYDKATGTISKTDEEISDKYRGKGYSYSALIELERIKYLIKIVLLNNC